MKSTAFTVILMFWWNWNWQVRGTLPWRGIKAAIVSQHASNSAVDQIFQGFEAVEIPNNVPCSLLNNKLQNGVNVTLNKWNFWKPLADNHSHRFKLCNTLRVFKKKKKTYLWHIDSTHSTMLYIRLLGCEFHQHSSNSRQDFSADDGRNQQDFQQIAVLCIRV